MLTDDELLILKSLRKDARTSVASIADRIGIPTSRVYSKMRKLEQTIILRYTSILRYPRLRMHVRVNMVLRSRNTGGLLRYLKDHSSVNSIYRTRNLDFYIETVFPDIAELYRFTESLEKFKLISIEQHHIIEDIVREKVLS